MTKNTTPTALLPLHAHLDALTPTRAQEEASEFNADVPDWEAREAEATGREDGTILDPRDLDDHYAPVESTGVPMADFDAYLAMCYVDPAERDF